jgi:hypothetical protein
VLWRAGSWRRRRPSIHHVQEGGKLFRSNAGRLKSGPARSSRRDRTLEVNAAAGVLDNDDHEALSNRVLRRIAHAEIEGEAGEE